MEESGTPGDGAGAANEGASREGLPPQAARLAGLLALLYYAAYMAYLWLAQENELWHWLTLVAVPLVLLLAGIRVVGGRWSLRDGLAAVGLRRGRLRRGLLPAALVGLTCSAVQLALSDRRGAIWDLIVSGRAFIYLPIVFVLLLLTAGFTEEFFFRGVLQTRLSRWWRSDVAALLVAAVLFGLYHFPYAYLNQSWSSHGNLLAALGECAFSAGAGVILGLVYWRSGENLLAAVLAHTLIDILPAMTLIKFSVSLFG